MPNLFSDLPVAIFSWVLASTSGFTRIATGTVAPMLTQSADSARISGSLSMLNWRMPPSIAMRISGMVLPTPEKTIRSPGTPAALARAYSPPETTSMPAPRSPISFSTARLLFDLTAKQTRWSVQSSACRNRPKCRVSVAAE